MSLKKAEISLSKNFYYYIQKTIFTYIQGLQEIISNLKPRTLTEKRRMQLAKQHLREVKRFARKMQNDIGVLQEKLNILEESTGDE